MDIVSKNTSFEVLGYGSCIQWEESRVTSNGSPFLFQWRKVQPFPVYLEKAESAVFLQRCCYVTLRILRRHAETTYQQVLSLVLIGMDY